MLTPSGCKTSHGKRPVTVVNQPCAGVRDRRFSSNLPQRGALHFQAAMTIAFSIDFPRIVAVEVTGSAKKPRLKRVAVGELAEPRNEDGTMVADRQAHLNGQVAKFIKENKLASGKQYLLVGPDAMRFRDLRLAFSDKRQINRVLPFQVEALIPNVPIEEMSLGYIPLLKEPEGSLLLVHAADKSYIRQRLTALEEAGCSIEGIDSHLSGTLNLGLLHPELAADKPPTLWLDFAGTTAAVILLDHGNVQAARVFVSPYLAGASGATATATDAKSVADQARREAEARAREIAAKNATDSVTLPGGDSTSLPKGESVNMGAAQVADRIRHMSRDDLMKFIQRVGVEARRTLAMSRHDAEPARLVVSGLGAQGGDLATLLSNELQLESGTAIALMDSVSSKGEVSAPDLGELTYLTGVALKGLGRDLTGIDFRYGDLAPGTLLDYARTPLAFTATLALLFGGILFLVSYTHVRRYEADILYLRDQEPGLRYYFDKVAFKDVDKTKKASKQVLAERTYTVDEEDAANEITTNHKKLADHQKRLEGKTTDNFERPVPADVVLSLVLKTISDAKPSYDFALLRVDVKNNNLNLVFLASQSETPEDLKGVGGVKEADRMFDAFRKLTRSDPKMFQDEPKLSYGARTQPGPGGRNADVVTLQIPLVKPERKKPAATTTTKPKGT